MTAHDSSRRRGLGVLAIFAGVSLLVGPYAYYRYRASEAHIIEALKETERLAPELTVEQCVDHVVSWTRRCEAMASMCQWTGPRMMKTCLIGRDRRAYCEGLEVATEDTRFGFKACRARGATRGLPKKACADAYRAIDRHCRKLTGAPGRASPSGPRR